MHASLEISCKRGYGYNGSTNLTWQDKRAAPKSPACHQPCWDSYSRTSPLKMHYARRWRPSHRGRAAPGTDEISDYVVGSVGCTDVPIDWDPAMNATASAPTPTCAPSFCSINDIFVGVPAPESSGRFQQRAPQAHSFVLLPSRSPALLTHPNAVPSSAPSGSGNPPSQPCGGGLRTRIKVSSLGLCELS